MEWVMNYVLGTKTHDFNEARVAHMRFEEPPWKCARDTNDVLPEAA
jgi:hypothetical protein